MLIFLIGIGIIGIAQAVTAYFSTRPTVQRMTLLRVYVNNPQTIAE